MKKVCDVCNRKTEYMTKRTEVVLIDFQVKTRTHLRCSECAKAWTDMGEEVTERNGCILKLLGRIFNVWG